MDFVNVLLSILGIGFLIFVHELGHFLAAKKVGIRVETFALGFQPTIFGWKARILAIQRGETEYVIGLLPFGGYVKMAGEELSDPRTGSSDEYASKSPSQRAFVLVAGAAMNLIFGFLLFMLAFSMGVPFLGTRVGLVESGSPAWNAGLRPGDRITAVDDDPKQDFTDLRTTIALSGEDEDLRLTVDRVAADGSTRELEVSVRPELQPTLGILTIGVAPASDRTLIDVPDGSLAAEAGVRTGDTIVRVRLEAGGDRLELPVGPTADFEILTIQRFLRTFAEGVVELDLRNGEEPLRTVRIPFGGGETRSGPPSVGIVVATRRVLAVQPGSPAEGRFPLGSEVLAIDGSPITTFDLWSIAERSGGDTPVRLTFSDGTEGEFEPAELIPWLGHDLELGGAAPRVTRLASGGAGRQLGLEVGDRVDRVGNTIVTDSYETGARLSPGTEVVWTRPDGERRTGRVPAGEALPLGVDLASAPVVGRVFPGGPAEEIGVLPGDRIVRAGGLELASWDQFFDVIAAVRGNKDGKALSFDVERAGETVAFEAELRPLYGADEIGLAPMYELVRLQTGLVGAIGEGWDQTIVWGKRIFMMIGALVRQEVSPKNLAGPVGIVHIGQSVAREGISKLIFVLAMISVNLGIFNLLPFPILDGGHLLFLLIEKIKGSPVDENVQGWVHLVAFVMLIGLAIFVTYHDILRLAG